MSSDRTALVVTSIASPNEVLRSLAAGALQNNWSFYIIGDLSSPAEFEIEGADFYGINKQLGMGLMTAGLCPTRHYARKNLGYLLAIRNGAEVIVETDDDNFPLQPFWSQRSFTQRAPSISSEDWVNVYSFFTESLIWPRGLPLDVIAQTQLSYHSLPSLEQFCPIQQGLANENPDVDAIYRLILPLPQTFHPDRRLMLSGSAWCPFNSQNTAWAAEVFPLLYLPAYCSFRMTDIWRSFVAQRIAYANGWSILFHEPTVYQQRNDHDLNRDFRDEVPGYLHNRSIRDALLQVDVKAGSSEMGASLHRCYEKLVTLGFLDSREIPLLEAWIDDLSVVSRPIERTATAS